MDLTDSLHQAFAFLRDHFPFPDQIKANDRYEMAAIVMALRHHLPSFEGLQLLDIGSGSLDKTAVLQQVGFQCTGVDDLSDPWHLEGDNVARIESFAHAAGIRFYRRGASEVASAIEASSFDVVCCLSVIEHLHESPRELLLAMRRYLRPGGLAIIVTPNAVNLRKRLSVLAGRSNHVPVAQFYDAIGQWRGHVREYTLREVAYICRRAGLEVLTATTFEHFAYDRLPQPLRSLYIAAGCLVPTLRSGLLVVGRNPNGRTSVRPGFASQELSVQQGP